MDRNLAFVEMTEIVASGLQLCQSVLICWNFKTISKIFLKYCIEKVYIRSIDYPKKKKKKKKNKKEINSRWRIIEELSKRDKDTDLSTVSSYLYTARRIEKAEKHLR